MTRAEFDAWSPHSVANFAAQQVAAGLLPPGEATTMAWRAFGELLPQGLATPQHHFWTVHETDGPAGPVGHLWLRVGPGENGTEGYVYDVELEPAARGRGLGRATMLAAEGAARGLGATALRLNVFGHNPIAIRLYDGVGFAVTGATMSRTLDDLPPSSGPDVELRELSRERRADVAGALADDLLWTAYVRDEQVGQVWLAVQDRSDGRHALCRRLEVDPTRRGRGYAEAIGLAALRAGREHGVRTVSAEIGPDPAARRLCDRLGLVLTAQTMVKPLPSG